MIKWPERLLDRGKLRDPASRTYRYMSRLIERDFERSHGVCLAFYSLESERLCADALLMLAHSLRSELGSRVLIVDARVKDTTGGLTERLGFDGQAGYSDVMRDGLDHRELPTQSTVIDGVDVLPIGTSTGISASTDRTQLRRLLDAARSKYGHVLLQIGDVLDDTRYLVSAAQADGVFILATENQTRMRALDESRRLLRTNGVQEIRVVVVGAKD